MDRTDEIEARLSKHITEDLRSVVAIVPYDKWAEIEGEQAKLGWLPPEIREVDGQEVFVVAIQPLVLATFAADLEPADYDVWMDLIEWTIESYIIHTAKDRDMPADERARLIENEMYERCGARILRFVTDVQFQTLTGSPISDGTGFDIPDSPDWLV